MTDKKDLSKIEKLVPIGLSVIGLILIFIWFNTNATDDFIERVPAEWDQPGFVTTSGEAGPQFGQLIVSDGKPSDLPGYWPNFRGPNLDAICSDEVPLARTWPQEGPPVLWSIEPGRGFAGAAVMNGCVYLIDYDEENEADAIRCLSLADGSEIWRYSYPVKVPFYHGMSRTVPAVTEQYLVTIGPKCHVTCLDPNSGELRWSLDLVKDFGTAVPEWYNGQCPLIDDGKAIIAPSGDVLMMAVDCETGEILWQTPNPNPRKWKMSHSSVMPIDFMGIRMYVYCTDGSIVGVSAQDGTLLWEYVDWGGTLATIVAPLVIGDGRIFFSGGYKAGGLILQLQQRDETIVAQPVFHPQLNIALKFQEDLDSGIISNDLRSSLRKSNIILSQDGYTITTQQQDNQWLITDGIKQYSVRKEQQELVFCTTRIKPEIFDSDQHTPILYNEHIFGVRTPDQQLVCLDLEGNLVWESTRDNRFGSRGLGPYAIADGMIYVLDDEGTLTIAEASTSGFKQLAQAEVIEDGLDAWAPMAFAAGRLIIRDMNKMICLDIAQIE